MYVCMDGWMDGWTPPSPNERTHEFLPDLRMCRKPFIVAYSHFSRKPAPRLSILIHEPLTPGLGGMAAVANLAAAVNTAATVCMYVCMYVM